MKIPLVDVKANYKSHKREIDKAIQSVIDSSSFILGPQVAEFERNFAKYCQSKFCVGVDSGLSALELGIRALGIGDEDEIITPVNSFIASSSSISITQAKPVWVDINEENYNIDPDQIEKRISKRTKAIMMVHLYGQPADIEKITRISQKHKLFLIEDACQAHGATYKDKKVGQFGDFAAFSFYPGKNLGAFGDGGALVTNSKKIANSVSQMRNYGQNKKYLHHYIAFNKRLDSLQAAVLNVKLKYLDRNNAKRRSIAQQYNKLLGNFPVIVPRENQNVDHVFHLYVLRLLNKSTRDKLLKHLQINGLQASIHYPIPIHMQKAYKDFGYKKSDFPVTEKISNTIISLPIYPEMSKEQAKYVAKKIKDFFK